MNLRRTALLLAAVLFLAGCTKGDDSPADMALTPGSAMVVSDVLLSEGQVRRATVSRDTYMPPTHALSGEADRTDPLEGRLLAVGTAFDDSVEVLPTGETPGFRTIDLNGRKVAVGRDRVWTWVTWRLPDCFEECQGYVAGRNLGEDEVVAAARGATADRNAPAIAADALPDDVGLLTTVGVDLRGFRMRSAEQVSWASGDGGLALTVVGDEAVAPLLRFWIDDSSTSIRDRDGSAGRALDESGAEIARATIDR